MKDVRGVCNFLGSVSSQQKFEVTDVKALGQNVSQSSDRPCYSSQLSDRSVLQLHVTPQFYLENERKIYPRGVRACRCKRHGGGGERESTRVRMSTGETGPWPFGFSFKFFFPPLGPALCKLGQPRVLFVLPEVLTLVLGPSFAQFLQAFPFLVF